MEQLLYSAEEGLDERLPDSIQSLVLARIDRLPPSEKRALQAASVIGQRFDAGALRHLLDSPTYDCQELVIHKLVRPEGSGYLFAHALIQEGVYASLLKRQRRDMHRRAAKWFAGHDSLLRAEHLDQADDEEAPRAYLAAALDQCQQYRYERALELVNRGLEITSGPDEFEIRFLEGELLRNLGSTAESINAYRRANEVAPSEVDRCRAWIGVAEGLRITEKHDELLEVLGHSEVIAKACDLPLELARIYQLRGNVHFARDEIDACLQAHTASLENARDASSPELEAQAQSGLGDAEFGRGRMISAHGYYHRCVELGRKHGLARVEAANLPQRGQTLLYANGLVAGANDCRDAAELAQKIHHPRATMVAAIVGAYIAEMGNPTEGKGWVRKGLDIARRVGARIFEAINLEFLGRFAAQEGSRLEAQRFAREAIAMLRESDSGMRFEGGQALGALALVTDDPTQRRSALKEGQELLRSGATGHNYLWFYRDAIEVCLQIGEWDEVVRYTDALDDYTSAEPLPWSDFFIARGRALAAFGRGQRDGGHTAAELVEDRVEPARVAGGGAAQYAALDLALRELVA